MNIGATPQKKPTFLRFCDTLLCGLIVCVFSLNGVIINLAGNWPGTKAGVTLLTLSAVLVSDAFRGRAPAGGRNLIT